MPLPLSTLVRHLAVTLHLDTSVNSSLNHLSPLSVFLTDLIVCDCKSSMNIDMVTLFVENSDGEFLVLEMEGYGTMKELAKRAVGELKLRVIDHVDVFVGQLGLPAEEQLDVHQDHRDDTLCVVGAPT
ncbi:hypothetical protein BDV36DRAFT_295016 [Aspergillus pseudocaelatus]|uniref:Uncharacterized protein n=1 Tax=Aspergillus pseudocaelatus TaxID=1825620 RepID=A0ABQ6WN96_9EURO|nr:hypothetical protein BDV36DRAFT_295016 [Aspergillus pseudocaelatus]